MGRGVPGAVVLGGVGLGLRRAAAPRPFSGPAMAKMLAGMRSAAAALRGRRCSAPLMATEAKLLCSARCRRGWFGLLLPVAAAVAAPPRRRRARRQAPARGGGPRPSWRRHRRRKAAGQRARRSTSSARTQRSSPPSLNGRRWCQAMARRGLVAGGGELRRRPYTMGESDR